MTAPCRVWGCEESKKWRSGTRPFWQVGDGPDRPVGLGSVGWQRPSEHGSGVGAGRPTEAATGEPT